MLGLCSYADLMTIHTHALTLVHNIVFALIVKPVVVLVFRSGRVTKYK